MGTRDPPTRRAVTSERRTGNEGKDLFCVPWLGDAAGRQVYVGTATFGRPTERGVFAELNLGCVIERRARSTRQPRAAVAT